MQLTLVRHGEAAPPVNGNDIKRPLTARGHAQAEQTATFLKDIVKPDIFVVSPLLRAQETLAHMNVVGHIAELLTHENFNPFALAEARIYDQAVIANGLSTQKNSFIPTI